ADARPFSYRDASGKAAGYSVALCEKIADQVKLELGLSSLAVEWVPVTTENRFLNLQQGNADLLCGADTATLTRRKEVAFSIPIFPSGIGAIIRTDAAAALRLLLTIGQPESRPIWRSSPGRTFLEQKTFSVVKGTTSETWLTDRLKAFELAAKVLPVEGYEAGIRSVLDGSSDVFYGARPILLETAKRGPFERDLMVLDRLFTYEPLALTLTRGDDDFRLVVDRTLSHVFRSSEFRSLYVTWFGIPNESTVTFFQQSILPE